jgi:flagellar basal body-associated protein FliL
MVRTIAIAVAIILMIAGAAVGVMKQLQWGPFAPQAEQAAVPESPVEQPRFIDMDPLVIPIFAEDRVVAAIQIQLKLETTGAANESHLNRIKPRLSDAFLRELYSFIPRLVQKGGQLDVLAIKRRLQMIADNVAGPGRINSVLVQSVSDAVQR